MAYCQIAYDMLIRMTVHFLVLIFGAQNSELAKEFLFMGLSSSLVSCLNRAVQHKMKVILNISCFMLM